MIEDLDDLDGEGPLWQQIRRALVKPIVNGDWAPGAKIPKELELIGRYGAARMTVHRAIRSLAGDGLVTRKRRFGTVVAARPPERPVLEIWDIAAEVARFGGDYGFEVLERQLLAADDPRCGLLAAGGASLLWLVTRHCSDGVPLQIEQRLINLDATPAAAGEQFRDVPPGTWLIQHVPWTDAEHAILAEPASRDMAQKLGVPAGTACLVVERRTWNERTPITFARLIHPGDRRRLVGRFRAAPG